MKAGINLIFMGGFSYPRGMAGTKRVQNVIDSLKGLPGVKLRVILQRQSSADNALNGVHRGVPYRTVMGDLLRLRMLAALPLLCSRTCAALKEAFRPGKKNLIYFYGPVLLESVLPLYYAKRLGYRIVFDFVEDYRLAGGLSRSPYHRARVGFANLLLGSVKTLASGIVVISSHLEKQYAELTGGKVPLHYMSISVDPERFREAEGGGGDAVSLFYAGSFGKKDGIPVLLDAFDLLAARHRGVRLLLTGRGDPCAMAEFSARRDASPYRERIEYRGYLEEGEYQALLNSADIPCMTRVDLAYAHAGFPFKLGEFLATGKPVIASRVSDVERLLRHGEDAMLVQPGDPAEICWAAEYLMGDREAARAIGRRGRELARSLFDYREQGKALSAFLGRL